MKEGICLFLPQSTSPPISATFFFHLQQQQQISAQSHTRHKQRGTNPAARVIVPEFHP